MDEYHQLLWDMPSDVHTLNEVEIPEVPAAKPLGSKDFVGLVHN